MINRDLGSVLLDSARVYPVVTLTGPRQSGKTTLCRTTFPAHAYVSLEPIDIRTYARDDPRGFLAEYQSGAIIDEVQNAPDLLTYLQGEVDANPKPGRFILTGSQHFGLSHKVSQSLAGRTAVHHLLTPSWRELQRFEHFPQQLLSVLWMGAYPRIHDQGIPAERWLADYITTYVQRDVRQLVNVGDLQAFTNFVRLCAGRSSQVLNLSSMGSDGGLSHNTVKSWLSVLEASFLCFRLPAWHVNIRKQLIKSPKLHFFDSGLLCYLLGIRNAEELRHHPLRGAIFESWVASEVYKALVHRGQMANVFHFRESRGLEVDLVVEQSGSVSLVEVKSGATISAEFLTSVKLVSETLSKAGDRFSYEKCLVYGGEESRRQNDVAIIPWARIDSLVKEGS